MRLGRRLLRRRASANLARTASQWHSQEQLLARLRAELMAAEEPDPAEERGVQVE